MEASLVCRSGAEQSREQLAADPDQMAALRRSAAARAWPSASVTMLGESMATTSSVVNPSSSRRSSSLPAATSPGRITVLCSPGRRRSLSVSPFSPTSTATLDRSTPHCIDRYL
uniref:Uncharacterized protein n=1 Tax=Oryza brachyantha TaxID=4533 RepID=J3N722_ORYBR